MKNHEFSQFSRFEKCSSHTFPKREREREQISIFQQKKNDEGKLCHQLCWHEAKEQLQRVCMHLLGSLHFKTRKKNLFFLVKFSYSIFFFTSIANNTNGKMHFPCWVIKMLIRLIAFHDSFFHFYFSNIFFSRCHRGADKIKSSEHKSFRVLFYVSPKAKMTVLYAKLFFIHKMLLCVRMWLFYVWVLAFLFLFLSPISLFLSLSSSHVYACLWRCHTMLFSFLHNILIFFKHFSCRLLLLGLVVVVVGWKRKKPNTKSNKGSTFIIKYDNSVL